MAPEEECFCPHNSFLPVSLTEYVRDVAQDLQSPQPALDTYDEGTGGAKEGDVTDAKLPNLSA